jgi:hypothetical protein
MTSILHLLQAWKHYLLGNPFVVKIGNVAIHYFSTLLKLSPKQARWKNFLAKFNMTINYWYDKLNIVAYALIRNA